MDNENNENSYDETSSQAKVWIQENLRIIVSVFIVAAIALGIYSYSQRAEIASEDEDIAALLDTKGGDQEAADKGASMEGSVDEGMMADEKGTTNKVIITEELSQETDTAFVEKAAKGDGTTHLARRALAHYLEKNTDSALTAEHKVYIEDYLRKNVGHSGWLNPNDSVSFSKDLIKQAIDHSKSLNDHQLQNLKKYSQNVSAYR